MDNIDDDMLDELLGNLGDLSIEDIEDEVGMDEVSNNINDVIEGKSYNNKNYNAYYSQNSNYF